MFQAIKFKGLQEAAEKLNAMVPTPKIVATHTLAHCIWFLLEVDKVEEEKSIQPIPELNSPNVLEVKSEEKKTKKRGK